MEIKVKKATNPEGPGVVPAENIKQNAVCISKGVARGSGGA